MMKYQMEENLPTVRLRAFVPPKRIKALRLCWYGRWEQLLQKYLTIHQALPRWLHAHSFAGGAVARHLSKKYDIPYIVTEHYDGFISGNIPKHWYSELKEIYRDASRVLAVSQSLGRAMGDHCEKIEIVPNMINTDIFYSKASSAGRDMPSIVSVGSLEPRKNHSLLIRVFAKIRESRPLKLILIGDGPLLKKLNKEVRLLGLDGDVLFTGNLPPIEVARYLRAAHLYVSTSKSESFALAPVEAVACGLPIVMLRCGSILESLDLDTVALISEEEKLETTILQQLDQLGNFDTLRASQTIRNRFAPEVIVNRLKAIYGS